MPNTNRGRNERDNGQIANDVARIPPAQLRNVVNVAMIGRAVANDSNQNDHEGVIIQNREAAAQRGRNSRGERAFARRGRPVGEGYFEGRRGRVYAGPPRHLRVYEPPINTNASEREDGTLSPVLFRQHNNSWNHDETSQREDELAEPRRDQEEQDSDESISDHSDSSDSHEGEDNDE